MVALNEMEDKRQSLLEIKRELLKELNEYKCQEGEEAEFYYLIPDALHEIINRYKNQIDVLSGLTRNEISIICFTYKEAGVVAKKRGYSELTSWIYLLEQNMLIKLYKKSGEYLRMTSQIMLGLTSKYGTSLKRWIICILILIVMFALINQCFLVNNCKRGINLFSSIYWSVITFTTVGYGDITPEINSVGMIFAAIEALIGVAMLGILVNIISYKNRRSI